MRVSLRKRMAVRLVGGTSRVAPAIGFVGRVPAGKLTCPRRTVSRSSRLLKKAARGIDTPIPTYYDGSTRSRKEPRLAWTR